MSDRVRGQETNVQFLINSVPQITTSDIKSHEMEWQFEIQKEGYIGETSDRRDTIFRGMRGSIEFHFENPDIFGIIASILLRATRRVPGTQINLKTVINYSDFGPTTIVIPGIAIGAVPLKFGSRSDYGMLTFPYEAQYATVQ